MSLQDSQTAGNRQFNEISRLDRREVDLFVWRPATISRIREHVVNCKHPAAGNMRRPPLKILMSWLSPVTPVDEQERERRRPRAGHEWGPPDHSDHRSFQTCVVNRRAEERQRVHLSGSQIDHVAVVVFPTRLILLGAAMVINREQETPGSLGSITKPDRRTTTVGTNLQKRCIRNDCRCCNRCIPQGIALFGRHEAFRS